MKEGYFVINHPIGLHARPAAKFTKIAKKYSSSIKIKNITRDGNTIDAKSLVQLIKIAVAQKHEIYIAIEGDDEDQAFEALKTYIENIENED